MRKQIKLQISIFFIFLIVLAGCFKPSKTEDKLSSIYKNKLTAYKGTLTFRMNKLRKVAVHDTILASTSYQKDRIEFLRMVVETNYYNLVLKSDAPAGGVRNTLRVDNYNVEIADPDYKYGKNKGRKYCDEDILQITKDFNEKYPPNKVPSNTDELYEYFFFKSEMLAYLLQNKCY
ncbi:MAG: hypothetical protein ACKVOU_03010 [Cytophagales bacterium]